MISLHLSVLTRLFQFTQNQKYYDNAISTLNWWLSWAFAPDTGRIWDTITAPGCTYNRSGLQAWTYNSGVILIGLADLYHITGNETLLDMGRSIAYAAMLDYTRIATGVVEESCEHDTPVNGGPAGCPNDLVVFKGALMMGLAEFYTARPDPQIYNFVNTNLLSMINFDLDDSWLAGQWWNGPVRQNFR
jgi:hypothetical protein